MGNDAVYTTPKECITQWQQLCARKEPVGTLTWKMMLLTRHQSQPSFACIYALPCSCLHACYILSLAAPVVDLSYLPFVLTPWSQQLGHAVDSNNLSLCCLLCLPCCSAGLHWQDCGSHCGRFCDYSTTVPCKDPGYTPSPPQIKLKLSYDTHCLQTLPAEHGSLPAKQGEMESRPGGGPP